MTQMQRNADDVWPDDAPPGTFDITPCTLAGRSATARLEFICPNAKHCSVFIGPEFEPRPTPNDPVVWLWDGHLERPTLTPSIDCGGCWHGFITAGVMK
jgi:hypothetical protein